MKDPVINRRVAEAAALRGFFQDQWEHLRLLASDWRGQRARVGEQAQRITSAVESIVEATDSRMRGVGDYRERLRSSAHKVLDHIQGLVMAMPPAILVNRAAVVTDPLVSRLFGDRQRVREVFCEDPAVQAYFHSQEHADKEQVFALLFLLRHDKNILGPEMRGEMIVKEVQQTSVAFHGHRLQAAGPDEDWVRSATKRILFDNVITHIKHQITGLRHSQSEEEKRMGLLHPERNMDNPAVYIDMLVEQLGVPGKLIQLQDRMLRVDRMGIKLPLDSKASSDLLRLYELEIGEDHSRVAAIVRYPRSEFLASVNQASG